VEVIVDEFWALAEMLIGVKYGRAVVVRHGGVERSDRPEDSFDIKYGDRTSLRMRNPSSL
jgi:hypothetical protein